MLNRKIIKFPLFWKFATISTIIVVIFGLINIFFLWTSVYKSFEKEIDKRCKVLAKIISEKSISPIVYDDYLSLYNILDEIKQSDPSISYIFILNNTNDLIAQTYEIKIPEKLLNANKLNSTEYNIKVIKTNNYKYPVIRDIAYPILNGDVGIVRLGIVEEHIQQEIAEATNVLLIMISAFFILGLLGALFFSFIITSPIKKISQKAQIINFSKIDTEDYKIIRRKRIRPFNIQINDELDVLVTKFSDMICRLKNNYTKLKETQSALVQAEKLTSLGTLSAGVAHEINNPISGIKNCTNRIIKNPDNINQNIEYIYLIKEATEKIENVVQHLLNFSRKQDISLNKTNLNSVIENSVILTSHKFQSKNIKVNVTYDEIYFVNGSANHLEQVFVNLLINSLDAILERKENEPNLSGNIFIAINKTSDKVYMSFKDNGIGIPIANRDKIFDPFFTSKNVGKGTGLGLSVSFNLIKEHGGKILLKCNQKSETEFIIELPSYSDNL